MAADVLSAYPEDNLCFEVYTDTSDNQLEACIIQNGHPVVYFIKKLTGAQINYTATEKESLSI